MTDVVQSPERRRFTSGPAYLAYARTGSTLTIEHTVVPPASEGQGIGSALVQAAVEFARDEGLEVEATCSFARRWLERHPGG
ncbi:MAG: GNAT family N-acetyltransferase [Mycobacteriales bacterium]